MTDDLDIDTSFFAKSQPQKKLATERQLDMIETLRAERGLKALTEDETGTITKESAGRMINQLLSMPRSQTSKYKDIPAGRYALFQHDVISRSEKWVFYQVDVPEAGRWAGNVFLSRLLSDDKVPVRGTIYRDVMDAILVDPERAAKDYGKESKRCSVCHKLLTNEDSRAAGIGPDCAKKRGW